MRRGYPADEKRVGGLKKIGGLIDWELVRSGNRPVIRASERQTPSGGASWNSSVIDAGTPKG
jgi:hypothetical protein